MRAAVSREGKRGRILLPLVLVACLLALAGGNYVLHKKLQETRSSLKRVLLQESNVVQASRRDEALLKVYKGVLASLSRQPVEFPRNQVEFLSNVETELTQVGVDKVSIVSTRVDVAGALTATVQFAGPYYQLLEGIAGWRTMEEFVIMKSLSFTLDSSGKVKGTTLLETRVEEEGS